MRKTSLLALTILASTNSFAYQDYKAETVMVPVKFVPQKRLQEGFYAGLSLDFDAYKVRQSLATTTVPGVSITANPSLSAKGWGGMAIAGYGRYFRRFYLGGEFLAGGSSADMNYSIGAQGSHYDTSVQARGSYGIGLLPGFLVNRTTMIYGKLGVLRTLVESTESGLDITGPFNITKSQWANGINFGVGMETVVYRDCYNNVTLRGEYTYTTYSAFTSEIGTKFAPSNNQFALALIYHFTYY